MENIGAELGKLCKDIHNVLCDGCEYKISALKSAEPVQQSTNTRYKYTDVHAAFHGVYPGFSSLPNLENESVFVEFNEGWKAARLIA